MQNMKIQLFILLILLSNYSFSNEVIYKTVDKDGNIIFGDKPSISSEKIILPELQTIKNPNPIKNRPIKKKSHAPKNDFYKAISVISPANDSAVRNNAGNISISINLKPSLKSSDIVIIKLDGKKVSSGSILSVSLNNISRGTHTIEAEVLNYTNKLLISTKSSFTLLRAHQ